MQGDYTSFSRYVQRSQRQLYEAEMRNASIEVEVREEVTREMQETLAKMHADFANASKRRSVCSVTLHVPRLKGQMLAGEVKTDRKIDIVARMTPAANRTYRAASASLSLRKESRCGPLRTRLKATNRSHPRLTRPYCRRPSPKASGKQAV